jgi:predicted DNA-binding transcriptional regulator YafY
MATDALLRQWTLYKHLPRSGSGKTAAEITALLADQGIVVHKRSVERDLRFLHDVLQLDVDDSTKPFRWARRNDALGFTSAGLTTLQSLLLLTAEVHLKALMPRTHMQALRPLFDEAREAASRRTAGQGIAAWPESIAVVPTAPPLLPPEIYPDVLETVHQALLDRRQVHAGYTVRLGGLREWSLHPVGLVHRGPVTYLASMIDDHDDVRLLPLHRFRTAKASTFEARRPPPSAMHESMAIAASGFNDRGPVRLVLEMDATAAQHLQEARLSEDQTVQASDNEEWVILSATVADTDQLRWWLRGYGDQVEVLEPSDLRSWMAETTAEAAGYYEDD